MVAICVNGHLMRPMLAEEEAPSTACRPNVVHAPGGVAFRVWDSQQHGICKADAVWSIAKSSMGPASQTSDSIQLAILGKSSTWPQRWQHIWTMVWKRGCVRPLHSSTRSAHSLLPPELGAGLWLSEKSRQVQGDQDWPIQSRPSTQWNSHIPTLESTLHDTDGPANKTFISGRIWSAREVQVLFLRNHLCLKDFSHRPAGWWSVAWHPNFGATALLKAVSVPNSIV